MTSKIKLAIVAPCYNEEAILPISIPKFSSLLKCLIRDHDCSDDSFVVLVDDGSVDQTWNLIANASSENSNFHGIKLSRNAGHQNALMAGLEYVTDKCDAVISIDADLQDDLDALPKMLDEFRSGSHIVLGVKASRVSDALFKRITAKYFYKLMRFMGVDLVENHADCRLMSAKTLTHLSRFPEKVLFLRGLQPLLHSKITTVHYHLNPRLAGESKYPIKKMLTLAWNGITSFSVVPLRLISGIGATVFLFSSILAIFALYRAMVGDVVPGWASVTIPLYLLGGLLMLSIGIVGEYVGKLYIEVKSRPRYLIDEVFTNKQ